MGGSVAVLFADVSGSAKLVEKLGQTEALRAVERCLKRIDRAVAAFNGRQLDSRQDEILAGFPSAEEALQAAIEMQQRVRDLPPVSGVKLAIRIGCHVGPVDNLPADLQGETISYAAKVVDLAASEHIVFSQVAADQLSGLLRPHLRRLQGVALAGPGGEEALYEFLWQQEAGAVTKTFPAAAPAPLPSAEGSAGGVAPTAVGPRLCLRYRGRAYLLDERTPMLTLGRDHGNDLVIEDRKASRHHARIERRHAQYFYVDQSTNGSFVSQEHRAETMIRHSEILLEAAGTVGFGSSISDPHADLAHFEHL